MSAISPVDQLFQQIFDKDVFEAAAVRLSCAPSELFSMEDLSIKEGVTLTEEIEKEENRTTFRGVYQGKDVTVKLVDMPSKLEDRIKFVCCLSCWKLSRDPSIGRFIGAGISSESTSFLRQIFVVLELYTIGSLRKTLTDHVMEWKVKLCIARDIVESLKYLHDRQLIHRNINTSAYFIGRNWRAQLCDFTHICHRSSSNKGPYHTALSTFMSPEMLLTQHMEPDKSSAYYDISTDIFNFGIILCEMITGREASTDFLIRDASTHYALDEGELIYSILPGCPESLEALCYQCCDSDPLKRPRAGQCLEELDLIEEELLQTEVMTSSGTGVAVSSGGVIALGNGNDDHNKSNDDISVISMATAEQPPHGSPHAKLMASVTGGVPADNGSVVTNPFEELLSQDEKRATVTVAVAAPSTSASSGVYGALLDNLNTLEAAVRDQSSDPLMNRTVGSTAATAVDTVVAQQYLSGVSEINQKIGLMQSQIDEIRQSVMLLVNQHNSSNNNTINNSSSTSGDGSAKPLAAAASGSGDVPTLSVNTDAESSSGSALAVNTSTTAAGAPIASPSIAVSVSELPPRINPLDYGSVYDIIVNPTTAAAVQLLQDIHRLHAEYDRNIQSLSLIGSPMGDYGVARSGTSVGEAGDAGSSLMHEIRQQTEEGAMNEAVEKGAALEAGSTSSEPLRVSDLLPDPITISPATASAPAGGGSAVQKSENQTFNSSSIDEGTASVGSDVSSVRPLSMSESFLNLKTVQPTTPTALPTTTAGAVGLTVSSGGGGSGNRGSVIDFSPFSRRNNTIGNSASKGGTLRAKIDDLKRRTGLTDDAQTQSEGSPYHYDTTAADDRSEQLSRDLNFFMRVADRYETAQQQIQHMQRQQQLQQQQSPRQGLQRQDSEPQPQLLQRQSSFRSVGGDVSVFSASGGRSVSPTRAVNAIPLRSSSRERSRERYRRPPSPGDPPLSRVESFRSSYDEPVDVRWSTNVKDCDWGDYRRGRGRKRPHIAPGSPSHNQLNGGAGAGGGVSSGASVATSMTGGTATTPTAAASASAGAVTGNLASSSGSVVGPSSVYSGPRKPAVPKQRGRSKSPNRTAAALMEADPNSLFGSPRHPMSVRETSNSAALTASWGSPYFNPSGSGGAGGPEDSYSGRRGRNLNSHLSQSSMSSP